MWIFWLFITCFAFWVGLRYGRWSILDKQRRERETFTKAMGLYYNILPKPGEPINDYRSRITDALSSFSHRGE